MRIGKKTKLILKTKVSHEVIHVHSPDVIDYLNTDALKF